MRVSNSPLISKNLPFIVNCYYVWKYALVKKKSYLLGVTANTMYCAAFLKAPPLLSGPYVHLGRQAWEAGKERLCMYMKKKPGSLQDRLGKERGLEAE